MKKPGHVIGVRVDDENNATLWWEKLRERAPMLAQALAVDGMALMSEVVFDLISDLEGWEGGPAHAPHPLMGCDPSDLGAGSHRYFEGLR